MLHRRERRRRVVLVQRPLGVRLLDGGRHRAHQCRVLRRRLRLMRELIDAPRFKLSLA